MTEATIDGATADLVVLHQRLDNLLGGVAGYLSAVSAQGRVVVAILCGLEYLNLCHCCIDSSCLYLCLVYSLVGCTTRHPAIGEHHKARSKYSYHPNIIESSPLQS